jgi:hypothetical protein
VDTGAAPRMTPLARETARPCHARDDVTHAKEQVATGSFNIRVPIDISSSRPCVRHGTQRMATPFPSRAEAQAFARLVSDGRVSARGMTRIAHCLCPRGYSMGSCRLGPSLARGWDGDWTGDAPARRNGKARPEDGDGAQPEEGREI